MNQQYHSQVRIFYSTPMPSNPSRARTRLRHTRELELVSRTGAFAQARVSAVGLLRTTQFLLDYITITPQSVTCGPTEQHFLDFGTYLCVASTELHSHGLPISKTSIRDAIKQNLCSIKHRTPARHGIPPRRVVLVAPLVRLGFCHAVVSYTQRRDFSRSTFRHEYGIGPRVAPLSIVEPSTIAFPPFLRILPCTSRQTTAQSWSS